jgi:hypothetical protein
LKVIFKTVSRTKIASKTVKIDDFLSAPHSGEHDIWLIHIEYKYSRHVPGLQHQFCVTGLSQFSSGFF